MCLKDDECVELFALISSENGRGLTEKETLIDGEGGTVPNWMLKVL